MPVSKQPILKPVHFRSVNLASQSSANIRWASADSVNFMDHLYFLTNFVLDYLLEDTLPQELMNQTLLNDPVSVVVDHRNELITHFHKLLIAACVCLCIGISIPLFGFMIACCWCSGSSKSASKRPSSRSSRSNNRPTSRSRSSNHRGEPIDSDWLALTTRDSTHLDPSGQDVTGSRYNRDRRRRHGRGHRRSNGPSSAHYRSRSLPPSLRYESSCHPCLRTFFSSNLFIILLLVAFFTVCAFVTNEYADNGVKQLPKAFNQSMDDIQTYLNNTDYEVDNLLRVNYNQLVNEINTRLDTSGTIIKHKLAVSSEAIALVNLSDIVSEFNDTKFRLEGLDKELSILKSLILTAKKVLADFRMKFEKLPPNECSFLRRKYNNLDDFRILPLFEKLPDVKPLIRKVNNIMETNIVSQVHQGKDNFDKFGAYIQREVNGKSTQLKNQLTLLGKKLSSTASEISQYIRWPDQFFNKTRSSVRKLDQYTEYEQYRRYASLGGSAIILLILLCYTLGWLYGSCRPQPTARTYKTHIKTSASASFPFSCGIFIVFLLFLPLILAAIVLFMTGSVGDKIVCQVIKHPEQRQSKQIYAMLQNKFLGANLSLSSVDDDKSTLEQIDGKGLRVYQPNFADLIARCHQNNSIYKVLKLGQYDRVNLRNDGHRIFIGLDKNFYPSSAPEFKKFDEIDKRMRALIKDINIDSRGIVLLTPQAEETLKNSMGLSFDDVEKSFTKLYDNGVLISSIDIQQLVKDMHTQKSTLNNPEVESDLNVTIYAIKGFSEDLPNITGSLLNLREGIRHLKLRMFHGRSSFANVTTELIAKVRSAESQLRTSGTMLLQNAANEFVDELDALIDQYANHVKNQVENVIGQCEPLSRALNSTTSTLCDDIILPFNGFWLSAISALILLLPSTLLAYALRELYRLAKRGGGGAHMHNHSYSYTDQEDEISNEDDSDEIAFTYHIARHGHPSHKPSSSAAIPSAPMARDDGWSPSSQGYIHNSRPPPYAV